MRVLVTVGTTPFPRLIRFIDSAPSRHTVVIQSAEQYDGTYATRCFAFSDDIESDYAAADLIITHAGAGSVYRLLERQARICVIPNLDRVDPHQIELANYVAMNRLGFVVRSLNQYRHPDELIDAALSFTAAQYQRPRFLAAGAILRLLDSPSGPLTLPSYDDIIEENEPR